MIKLKEKAQNAINAVSTSSNFTQLLKRTIEACYTIQDYIKQTHEKNKYIFQVTSVYIYNVSQRVFPEITTQCTRIGFASPQKQGSIELELTTPNSSNINRKLEFTDGETIKKQPISSIKKPSATKENIQNILNNSNISVENLDRSFNELPNLTTPEKNLKNKSYHQDDYLAQLKTIFQTIKKANDEMTHLVQYQLTKEACALTNSLLLKFNDAQINLASTNASLNVSQNMQLQLTQAKKQISTLTVFQKNLMGTKDLNTLANDKKAVAYIYEDLWLSLLKMAKMSTKDFVKEYIHVLCKFSNMEPSEHYVDAALIFCKEKNAITALEEFQKYFNKVTKHVIKHSSSQTNAKPLEMVAKHLNITLTQRIKHITSEKITDYDTTQFARLSVKKCLKMCQKIKNYCGIVAEQEISDCKTLAPTTLRRERDFAKCLYLKLEKLQDQQTNKITEKQDSKQQKTISTHGNLLNKK